MDGLRERPGLDPVLQLRQRGDLHQRQNQSTTLDGVQQGLILQVRGEDVTLVLLHVLVEVHTVDGQVDFFRTPEERQLASRQVVELVVLDSVVSSHVNRSTEEHRLINVVHAAFAKSAIGHFSLFSSIISVDRTMPYHS